MASLLPNRDIAWSSTFHFQQNWSVPVQPDRSSSLDSYQSEEPIPYAGGNSRKLNHNASERHRRKKINSLYSSLRSLLPTADQSTQKLSIPNTVARVVKYIPELQEEVERLVRKKEELSSRPRLAEDETRAAKRTCNRQIIENLPAVSATRVGDDQIAAQICGQADRSTLSHLVERMEDDGFLLLNLTSFHASPATVLYHLHFHHPVTGKGSGLVEPDEVCHKLLSLYEKGAKVCP